MRLPPVPRYCVRSAVTGSKVRPYATAPGTDSSYRPALTPDLVLRAVDGSTPWTPAPAPFWITSVGPDDAPEADVGHAGLDLLGLPGGGAVALAVVLGAEVGAALDHPARDVGAGLLFGAVTAVGVGDAGVGRRGAAGVGRGGGVVGAVVVSGPFPDVAGHVEQPVPVGRVRPRRRGTPLGWRLEVL